LTQPPDDGRLAAYLLGRLSSEEEDAIEAEYLGAPEAYERLAAAEDEIIDAYAAGQLSADDARRFEERFLSTPSRRERVAFARALSALAAREPAHPPARRPSWLLPLVAVLPIALAAGWLLLSVRDLRTELAQQRERQAASEEEADMLRTRNASLQQELAGSGVTTQPLEPGLERDAAPPSQMTVPPDHAAVRLRLSLPRDAGPGPFAARVETAEGRVVAELRDLPARAGEVDVVVPASSLSPGTYVVLLQAGRPLETLDTYHLRVRAP
jgi:hypothetical protein